MSIAGLLACSGSTPVAPTADSQQAGETDPSTPASGNRATATPEPLAKVLPAHNEPNKPRQFIEAPDRDLFRLTRELVPGSGDIPRTIAGDATEFSVGRIDTFWLVDLASTRTYQSEFRLALVTPHAYWYVEDGLDVGDAGLERSAARFEEDIYPVVTQVFGSEWSPGIDNDPRLNILNARLSSVAGYFSSTDEYPTGVRPRSNQREIIYINARSVPPGGLNYDQVLAHELQHAIHWNADASEDTWVNEGLAELSSSIALETTFSIRQFLRGAPISLVNWPTSSVGSINNYGAASLFMHFLTEHHGGRDDLRDLLEQQGDSIVGIDRYLEDKGYDARFDDVFRAWAVANILDRHLAPGDAIQGYDNLDVRANISRSISGFKETESEIPQYAVEYVELRSISEPFELSFQGQTTTELLPIDVGPAGCWWSNSGDSIDSTLSHRFEIPVGVTTALEYEIWYEIEEDWDYVYVEVSVDGGKTWQIVETPETTPENPIGNGFGPGYTGSSHGWLTDSADLSSFAGRDILVRFQYVTDDAINADGACFRNLVISSPDKVAADEGWEAQGFVFVDDLVRQYFQVQLITTGENPTVRRLTLDASNAGKISVLPPGDGEQLIVAVGSLAEKTRQLASYTLSLKPTG